MKVEREKKEVTNSIVPYSFLNHRMTPCLFVTVAFSNHCWNLVGLTFYWRICRRRQWLWWGSWVGWTRGCRQGLRTSTDAASKAEAQAVVLGLLDKQSCCCCPQSSDDAWCSLADYCGVSINLGGPFDVWVLLSPLHYVTFLCVTPWCDPLFDGSKTLLQKMHWGQQREGWSVYTIFLQLLLSLVRVH